MKERGGEIMSSDWNTTGISQRFIYQLREYCRTNNDIDRVVLFGSRARGDYRTTSDIDLAVFANNCSHSQQNLIEHDISNMLTPLKIDVVFMNRLTKDNLLSNIKKDGVVIYEQGEALRKA